MSGKQVSAYAITVTFEVDRVDLDTFLRLVLDNAAQSVRNEPECLRFDVLTPFGEDGPAEVFLYEIYTDRAAFDVHLASPHFKSFDASTLPIVRKKTVTAFEVVQNAKGLGGTA